MPRSLAIACLLFFPTPATGQDAPELLGRFGDLDRHVLVDVRAAALKAGDVAVLTAPEPALHRFGAGGVYRAWGRKGEGPAELSSPVDVAWPGGSLLVLDVNLHKLVSFGEDGSFQAARSLSGEWGDRVFVTGGDTVVGTFVPMGGRRAVVRLRGEARDTLFRYEREGVEVRLEAPGAPGYTTPHPFTPETRWTVLSDGALAVWRPAGDGVALLDGRTGREVGRIGSVGATWPLTDADREAWLHDTFVTAEFMGRRVFEPLLPVARERLEFGERFPAVLELLPDPAGGVWIRKTTAPRGQVWVLLARSGRTLGSLRLPAGRELLAVGEGALAARAADELDVELVELYRRPGWAGGS